MRIVRGLFNSVVPWPLWVLTHPHAVVAHAMEPFSKPARAPRKDDAHW